MKKKILFVFLITVISIIVFSLSVSAKTVISENNLDENGDIVSDLLVDLGDNYHISSVDISYLDINGQEKNGKFYYETSYWAQKNKRQVKKIYIPNDFDMSQVIYILDKVDIDGNGEFAGTELIKLYEGGGTFRMYTYASYENGTFTETENAISNIEIISYSKYFEKFPDKGFGSKASKLTTITYNGKEPIQDALIVSPLIDEIFSGSFGGDGNSLTANSIYTPFKKLIFEDRDVTVGFGQYCFTRCIIEEIYFGKGTYNLYGNDRIALLFGANYDNGNNSTLKRVILGKEAKIASGSISWNVSSYEVIVLGTESESKEYYETTNQARLTNATNVTYNPCYYGHTVSDDFNCETALACTICQEEIASAITHNAQTSISYDNGYLNKGVKHVKCLNDGCNYDVNIDTSPIFLTNGYSVPEDGRGEIAICFVVNKEALSEYETINNECLTYGAFAIAYDKITNDAIIDTDTAICVEVDREYASFEMKLTGFVTDLHKEAKITLGAFTVNKNGNISYLQIGTPKENGFSYITYNEMVNA